jgi:hypothetical protein
LSRHYTGYRPGAAFSRTAPHGLCGVVALTSSLSVLTWAPFGRPSSAGPCRVLSARARAARPRSRARTRRMTAGGASPPSLHLLRLFRGAGRGHRLGMWETICMVRHPRLPLGTGARGGWTRDHELEDKIECPQDALWSSAKRGGLKLLSVGGAGSSWARHPINAPPPFMRPRNVLRVTVAVDVMKPCKDMIAQARLMRNALGCVTSKGR